MMIGCHVRIVWASDLRPEEVLEPLGTGLASETHARRADASYSS